MPPRGPQRVLAAANLVFTLGSGMYLTAGVLYFTEGVRLPAAHVGWGLMVAGIVSLGLSIVAGHLADRFGARGVYAITVVVHAVSAAGFLLVRSFWPFVVIVSLATGAKAAGFAARSPMIRQYGGERPQEFRAYMRAVTNVGIACGALFAGWAVQVGSSQAYGIMVVGIAVLTGIAAVFLAFVPAVEPVRAREGPRWIALRDRPYLLLTGLDGVMTIQFKVLTVALPLWLVGATTAPRWLFSAMMLVGTLIVVLFQVRASRGIDSPRAGGFAYRRAGAAFFLACGLIALSAVVPAWAAILLLVAAVVIHRVGELWHAAAGFAVSFALAPPYATGQYLGVFLLGAGLAEAFGPALLIWLCLGWGRPGWFVAGALLAVAGAAMPKAVQWAATTRSATRQEAAPA